MANRLMNQFAFSLEKAKCFLYGQVTIGSTGACTLVAAKSKGITSITRNAAGKYTIVLNDTWVHLFHLGIVQLLASGLPTACTFYIVSETVATAATKNIVIQFLDFAGAAVDPDSGVTLKMAIQLSNSTAI